MANPGRPSLLDDMPFPGGGFPPQLTTGIPDDVPPHPPNSTETSDDAPPDLNKSFSGVHPPSKPEEGLPHDFNMDHFRLVNSLIRDELKHEELERLAMDENPQLNLMHDPLLNVVIACGKTHLAVQLIERHLPEKMLEAKNCNDDTALHVAAAVGDCEVAKALFRKRPELVRKQNKKQETPLHKAALYGHREMFWCLVQEGKSSPSERREDGATMLHCAIMGDAPALALEIAKAYETQITSRNEHAVTPLQLMVTVPDLFRSQQELGPLESFLYDWIHVEDDSYKKREGDEEEAFKTSNDKHSNGVAEGDDKHFGRLRSKFPSNYATLFDLLELIYIPARWTQICLIKILKQLSPRIRRLEKKKKNHEEAMELIGYLAQERYYNFFAMGEDPHQGQGGRPPALNFHAGGGGGSPQVPGTTLQLPGGEKAAAPLMLLIISPVGEEALHKFQGLIGYLAKEGVHYNFFAMGEDPRQGQGGRPPAPNFNAGGGGGSPQVPGTTLQLPGEEKAAAPLLIIISPEGEEALHKFQGLIGYLAQEGVHYNFFAMGKDLGQGEGGRHPAINYNPGVGVGPPQVPSKAMSHTSANRWNEPPLILGAQMGLHDFVRKILEVCPQSATYLDTKGRNVLQVAIEHGNRKIVKTIRMMTQGANPTLPSWLLSTIEAETKNTILHFASKQAGNSDDAVQMQEELRWFKMVERMVPKELVYSRNKDEKTAHELFTENHTEMLKSGKNQLVEMGKTCSSLVAAVVFASSFSIPGEKDQKGNPVYFNRLPFKIFSHAYVIGLSCAATSLVLFLSLVISPYKEQQFRRAIPTKYFFACLSFAIALVAFLVSFTCNIFLQIYGGQRAETKDLVPLILELTVFPTVCFLVLFYRGSHFGPSFHHLWH